MIQLPEVNPATNSKHLPRPVLFSQRMRGATGGMQPWRLAVLLLSLLVFIGCKSTSPSQYISPRIVGRVLDEQTRQPVRNVTIKRLFSGRASQPMDAPKGGQILEDSSVTRTGADGAFVIESEQSLALFRTVGWYAVTYTFEHADYVGTTVTWRATNAVNNARGEPVVNAGDLLLKRISGI